MAHSSSGLVFDVSVLFTISLWTEPRLASTMPAPPTPPDSASTTATRNMKLASFGCFVGHYVAKNYLGTNNEASYDSTQRLVP